MSSNEAPLPPGSTGSAVIDLLMSGQTLNTAFGHSLESQEKLYYLAYMFYSQAKYMEAMRLFGYLLTTNHADRRYYSGLAACLHMQKRHHDALKYYGIASILDLTDPEPVMRSAECYLALGDRPTARLSIDYALTQARAHERHHQFVARLEAMLTFVDAEPAAARAPSTKTQEISNE